MRQPVFNRWAFNTTLFGYRLTLTVVVERASVPACVHAAWPMVGSLSARWPQATVAAEFPALAEQALGRWPQAPARGAWPTYSPLTGDMEC